VIVVLLSYILREQVDFQVLMIKNMKNEEYHTVETVPEYINKDENSIPLALIYLEYTSPKQDIKYNNK
jgi:hypothetical protein